MWKLESQSFHPYWPRWDLNFRFIHCLSVTLPTFCPSEALVPDHVSVWKPRWSDGAELEGQSYSQRPRSTVVQWGCRVGCPCQGYLFAVICLCGAWVFTTFHYRIDPTWRFCSESASFWKNSNVSLIQTDKTIKLFPSQKEKSPIRIWSFVNWDFSVIGAWRLGTTRKATWNETNAEWGSQKPQFIKSVFMSTCVQVWFLIDLGLCYNSVSCVQLLQFTRSFSLSLLSTQTPLYKEEGQELFVLFPYLGQRSEIQRG